MLRRVAMLLGVALVVASCAVLHPKPPSGFIEGTSIHTVSVGGRDRVYRLHKPSGLSAPAGLVVVLHGGFGSAEQAERSYGWDQLADSSKFVVAYPDGVKRAWNVKGAGCCGKPGREHIDDVAFITAAVADVTKNVSIDASRVYATGMSNGGGEGRGFAHINGPPVPELNALWRKIDQCQLPVVTTSGSVTTSTAGCADDRGVVLVTVGDGGHHWPDFATAKLWEFFAGHPR